MRRRRAITAVLVTGGLSAAGLLAGCGDGGGLPGIDTLECDDDAACDDAVELGGRTFAVRCAAPDEARLGERVGDAGSDGRFAEARSIEGEYPADVVALRTRGDGVEWCADQAYVIGVEATWADDEDVRRVVCDEASSPDDGWCAPDEP